jgi:hypothetical protein
MQDVRIPAINILPVEVSVALDRGDRNSLPIDWKQLGQLSDGNEAFERELLGIFLAESQQRLQQAQQALIR